MSITSELREWVKTLYIPCSDEVKREAERIADRIDERVENIRFNEHHKGYEDGIMDGCSHYDPESTECMVSEEYGYIKLPKDADGEYIHIGDEVDTEHFGTVEVEGFMHHSVVFYNYSEQPAYLCTTPASLCRHHHEPTVEDVLREFAKCWDDPAHYAKGELVETFAEKLREAIEHERD